MYEPLEGQQGRCGTPLDLDQKQVHRVCSPNRPREAEDRSEKANNTDAHMSQSLVLLSHPTIPDASPLEEIIDGAWRQQGLLFS